MANIGNLQVLGAVVAGAAIGTAAGHFQARGVAVQSASSTWYPISQVGAGATGVALAGASVSLAAVLTFGGALGGSHAAMLSGIAAATAGIAMLGGTAWGMVHEHAARQDNMPRIPPQPK